MSVVDLGEANSFSELLKAAHVAEQRFGAQVWFRGHSDCTWHLIPSAHRRHPILEAQFAHHFRLRAPALASGCPQHKDYSSWLPLMQHYGLPTRLLDWTESLLVAAFFAVPTTAVGGTVWVLDPGKLNELTVGHLIPFLEDDRAKPIIAAAFDGKQAPDNCLALAVLAPRTDRRMAAQLGNYTVHSGRGALDAHADSSRFLAKIHIPASANDTIRGDLVTAGVRQSTLFPDLVNLAAEISELKAFGDDDGDLEAGR